jgi:hypothetical protein
LVPWVDVDEPYAKPPRVRAPKPSSTWNGELILDDGCADLVDVAVTRDADVDLTGCTELALIDASLDGAAVVEPGMVLDANRSELVGCDLSHVAVRSLRATRLTGCKLTGADLSGAGLHDVEFNQCYLRHAVLRMAQLRRVRFIDCTFDDVDCFELRAEDVEFPGTALDQVNVDRLQATRVDLRGATSLALSAVGSLAGCLIAEHQVPVLAYSLVFSVGTDVERG